MPPVVFNGSPSVLDRTVFTNRGPIIKRPLDLLTGNDLRIASETDVVIPTGSFNSSAVGRLISISGSAGGRNDGFFYVSSVLSQTRLKLENVSFDVSDVAATTALVVALANDLRDKFNLHRTRSGVHGSSDVVNVVSAPPASDLATAIVLLNDIRARHNAHIVTTSGSPGVHKASDIGDAIQAQPASNLPSAVILASEARRRFESHRLGRRYHVAPDTVDVVLAQDAKAVVNVYPGPLTGPFTWIYTDPRTGELADDPTDVSVLVNGLPVSVDAVFGLIGAIVLAVKPDSGDVVSVDYDYLNNPPARFLKLNDHGLRLNQVGNGGTGGYPGHTYRIRSALIDPKVSGPDLMSPVKPASVAWKYKALERAYTASLNDPNTLLFNTPAGRLTYPVLSQQFLERTIRYDPTSLPQSSSDPWTLEGDGTLTLASGGGELTITDSNPSTGSGSRPPFFTHELDLRPPSTVSSAFRAKVTSSSNDGCFTGVSFGVSDGLSLGMVGFILTDATNLSSACVMANDLKSSLNSHIVTPTVHSPDDPGSKVNVVDAKDLTSLVILVNEIRSRYETHRQKGGAMGVHLAPDSTNSALAPVATDLVSAVVLVNHLRQLFNSHRTQSGVHFVGDLTNIVDQVRQAGILTNRDFPEVQESWNAGASDWSEYATYRLVRSVNGDFSLFLSGSTTPIATATTSELPAISDQDGRFDPIQQTFFGPVGRESTSTSIWQFIRVNIAPQDANLIGDNKSVSYQASVVPELDPSAPWMTVGQEGAERIMPPGILLLDSTASAVSSTVPGLGASSGAQRGFLRMEPILSVRTTSALEFSVSGDWWTHSLDDKSACVAMDDDQFSVRFCLLQSSPTPATVTGSTAEPFPLITGETIIIGLGNSSPVSVSFLTTDTTAALVASRINAAFGFVVADVVSSKVRLTSQDLGSSARLTIVSGSAIQKLGFSPGQYFGMDSNPEPRISWYGENLPDLETPAWLAGGSQPARMFGRTLRIEDNSVTDFRVYSLTDPVVTNQAINALTDWKLDFRIRVLSFQSLGTVPATPPHIALDFAGAMVVVDEGPTGKNLELHLAVDGSGAQYLNLMSYNQGTGALDVVAQYAFAWNDGERHSYDVYTAKSANSVFVHADGVQLAPMSLPPSYLALNAGVAGPSVTFGSGGDPVTGVDLRQSRSVIDWDSVAVFRDSKLADPSSGSRRYVGVHKGGDPSLLASYYLHQIDWTVPHVYRIVRDPVAGVKVHVDGGGTPVISIPYDALTLPPASTSFLKTITSGRQSVAFGSFNPQEMARTRWDFLSYSIGKMTLTDRLVPPHQVRNQSNVIASSEHLRTSLPHQHFGFKVYSGGTPYDDFMADETIPAVTVLGEGTAPVPMTQDLSSRGGLIKVATPTKDIAATTIINSRGFVTNLEDDTINTLSSQSFLTSLVALANDVRAHYESHRPRTPVHLLADGVNIVLVAPATDLATSIALLNEIRTRFNAHLSQAGVHFANDVTNAIVAPAATDATSAFVLADALSSSFKSHVEFAGPHLAIDSVNVISEADAIDLSPTLIDLIENPGGIRAAYNAHRVGTTFHPVVDDVNPALTPTVVDLPSALVFLNDCKRRLNSHLSQAGIHLSSDVSSTVPTPDATDLASALLLANRIKLEFNDHRVLLHPHSQVVESDLPTVELVQDPTLTSISVVNDIREKYLVHVSQPRVHVQDDVANIILPLPATDLATAIALANAEKVQINLHFSATTREVQKIHTEDDVINVITAPDATDLPTLLVLIDDLTDSYESHRVEPGIHGSSVLIRLDPPSRVLYECARFWKTETGTRGLTSPFSDDETWHIDAFKSDKDQTLSLHGGAVPEQAQLVGAASEPFDVVGGETILLQVDASNNPVVTVVLQAGDTSLASIISRINSTTGLPSTLASSNGDGRLRLTSPTASPASAVRIVGGTGVMILGLDVPQHTPWTIISDDPSAVSVTLGSSGPTDYVRYATTGTTRTRYQSNSGLPDSPAELTLSLKIRINTVYSAAQDFDSNIYVGVSGIAGPGYSIGIGFDRMAGVRFVKLQDLNSGRTLFRKPFEWLDGAFHEYVLTRDVRTGTIKLAVS